MVKTLPFRMCLIMKSLTEVCLSNGTGMRIMAKKHIYESIFALQKYKIKFDFANIYSTFSVFTVVVAAIIMVIFVW